MKTLMYSEFFRSFVLRKKTELVQPNFLPISEIFLPKFSLVHYLPKHAQEYGPAVTEPFISNFPKDIFIDFVLDFDPVLGKGHNVAFDKQKAIKAYRSSHYTYNWTRNISSVYNRENVLVVENYGLMEKNWAYRPSLFAQYEQYYNRMREVLVNANNQAKLGKRKQFLRIDLPLVMPEFKGLQEDYRHHVKSFDKGLPNPDRQSIRLTKRENSYWILDWYAFLLGDYEHSMFSMLSQEALDDLHLIFTFNSKCLVVNLGLIKQWFDEIKKDVQRLNATKRFYLALINLTRGGVSEKEITEETEEENGTATNTAGKTKKETAAVVEAEGSDEEGRSTEPETEDVSGTAQSSSTAAPAGDILDIFNSNKGSNTGSDDAAGNPGSGADAEGDSDAVVQDVAEDWTGEVDDRLLEEEASQDEEVHYDKKDVFDNPMQGIQMALEERARDGSLSVAEQEFFVRKGSRYLEIEMDDGKNFADFMEIKPEELKTLKADSQVKGEFMTVLDDSMLQNRAAVLRKDYVNKGLLMKDISRCVLGIQNAGVCLTDFRHERITNVAGSYDTFTIQMHPVDGSQSTRQIRIPAVDKDGMFMVDEVKYHLQLQRMELPIRKINERQVALTSYYDSKLMISRNDKANDDYSRWLIKQIQAQAQDKKIVIRNGNVFDKTMKTPRLYSMMAKKFQDIAVKEHDLTFDFNFHKLVEAHPEFKDYNKLDKFLIGIKGKEPIWFDDYGNVYVGQKEVGTFEGLLGINTRKSPLEHCVVNIRGYQFPIGVVLCYYFGIDKLLKIIKATTRSVPMGNKPNLTEDEYAMVFNDEYLIFNRRERLTTLIFGGMVGLNNLGNFSRVDLNNKGVWVPLMGDPKVKPTHFKEMKNIFDLFIDPITKDELKRMGYSVTIHYLLIDAVKLLMTDYTRHEVELEEQRVVGYERFAGQIYGELCRSIRQYRNKGSDRKHTIDLNPEGVILGIITDTSVNSVEEVSPFHQLKDQEEVTFGGNRGRNEISMVKRTRSQLKSYKGVISESNKDSGKVGFISYLTSDPSIADYRGNIDLNAKPSNTGLFSVIGNLQYGGTIDSPQRTSFASIQASQAVSAQNYTPNILRTGYDNVLAHRTTELYSKIAQQDGKVTSVSKDAIVVTYKDGTTDNYPLGLVIGTASGEYHPHKRITDLKEGDTFKAGEALGWDDHWFIRDPFCPGQLTVKVGRMVRLALVEDQGVYEDSLEISNDFAQECVTPYIKCKAFLIGVEQALTMKVKVGDEVDYDTILCDVEDAHVADIADMPSDVGGIMKFGTRQVKSHHHGKVVAIEVKYNGQYEEMSPSVLEYVTKADKERARLAKITNSGIVNGNISSNLNVKKQSIMPGKVKIMVYIEALDPSVTADKYVIGNQMKGTVGNIMHRKLSTRDGREIQVKFSFKSLFNRMVLSLRNKLAANELVIHVTKRAVDIYRGRV